MQDPVAKVELFLGEDLPHQLLLTPLNDEDSSIIVDRLKQEADRHWGIDPRRSLVFAERIVGIGQARNDQRQIALGLMARGDAMKVLGETLQAWEALDQAGKMFEEAGDEVGWARTRIGRLYLSTMLNVVPQALEEAGRAREILIRYGERERLLRLIYQTAYVHNYLFEQSKALELYQSAEKIALELGEVGEQYQGIIQASIGTAYIYLGDMHQAEEYYERARAQYIKFGDTFNLAGVEADLGYVAQAQGYYRRGLQLMTSSLERSEAFSPLEATKIRWNILECYLGLNRLMEARDLARQVVDSFRSLNDAFELARGLLQLGTIEAELKNFTAAQDALDEAEKIYTSMDASSWKATVWLKRGRISLLQGEYRLAGQIALDAAEIFQASQQRVNHANAALLHGQAVFALADFQTAARDGRLALEIAQRDHVPALRYSTHLLLGQLHEKQDKLIRASHHYRAAAATIERVQRGLTITLRPGFLEDKALAWRSLIRLSLDEGQIGTAFEVLERAKSQALLGYLANQESLHWASRDALSRNLTDELEKLRAEHQWYYQRVYTLLQKQNRLNPTAIHQDLVEVRIRERRMRQITEQLYLHNEKSGAGNPIITPSLAEVQAVLVDDEVLVEYYNDGLQLYAFCINSHSILATRLPLGLNDLGRLLAQLRLNMSAALQVGPGPGVTDSLSENARRILGRLYIGLIEPLALPPEKWRCLSFVPYGALHFLPFNLLHDGSTYLFERYEVVVLPAAGMLTHPAPHRKPGALVLADTWDGRLPFTVTEAAAIHKLLGGKLFIGAAASRLLLDEQPLQILHIAAHGQYRLDQPDLSYIQLADGQVYADDLFQHDMSYELVTLSACETGKANVSGADELIGLGRGFLYSGAGSLILTLWQVADDTSQRLMEHFYLSLQAGMSKAAALRSAQQAIRKASPGLHPAYWGAFQLIGNNSPLTTWAENY